MTDEQLQQALAKMLPEKVTFAGGYRPLTNYFCWLPEPDQPPDDDDGSYILRPVLPTELLHLCWLVEQTLSEKEGVWFLQKLSQERFRDGERGTIGTLIDRCVHATWQQRTIALARVKGVEIV